MMKVGSPCTKINLVRTFSCTEKFSRFQTRVDTPNLTRARIAAKLASNQSYDTFEADTNASGFIELTFLDQGEYTIKLAGEGYNEYTDVVTVRSGKTTTMFVKLKVKSGLPSSGFPLAAILLGLLVAMIATQFTMKRP